MIKFGLLAAENIDEVFELEKLCFPDDPWGRVSFENEVDNPHSIFVTATDDKTEHIVGYGGVWLVCDNGDITNIAVHPDYRREGIGKKILDVMTDICKEKQISSITLEVRDGNLPAYNLYRKEGFVVNGRRKKYYKGIDDAILMIKEL